MTASQARAWPRTPCSGTRWRRCASTATAPGPRVPGVRQGGVGPPGARAGDAAAHDPGAVPEGVPRRHRGAGGDGLDLALGGPFPWPSGAPAQWLAALAETATVNALTEQERVAARPWAFLRAGRPQPRACGGWGGHDPLTTTGSGGLQAEHRRQAGAAGWRFGARNNSSATTVVVGRRPEQQLARLRAPHPELGVGARPSAVDLEAPGDDQPLARSGGRLGLGRR